MSAHRPHRLIAFVAGLLVFGAGVGLAAGLSGRFEVRSADFELKDNVYHLNARVELPVGDAVKQSVAQGVPLALAIELQVTRVRRFFPDADVASLTQRYQLQYNAVSTRYVLRNDNSGEQESFATMDAALGRLAVVHDVPVLDRSLVSSARRYEISVRAIADLGDVPLTLRILMFWVDDWHRESQWYTWTLQQ
jgi:Domain of unknown function (DUF4390)